MRGDGNETGTENRNEAEIKGRAPILNETSSPESFANQETN
jgi:hypothetical protein